MSAPDAATVAAMLAEHRAVVSGDDDGWHVVCSCGHNELGDDPLPHVAAALLAAPPIAQALAAVEAVARVEALADNADARANVEHWMVSTEAIRAALRPDAE